MFAPKRFSSRNLAEGKSFVMLDLIRAGTYFCSEVDIYISLHTAVYFYAFYGTTTRGESKNPEKWNTSTDTSLFSFTQLAQLLSELKFVLPATIVSARCSFRDCKASATLKHC